MGRLFQLLKNPYWRKIVGNSLSLAAKAESQGLGVVKDMTGKENIMKLQKREDSIEL